jgi:hypothetical protein
MCGSCLRKRSHGGGKAGAALGGGTRRGCDSRKGRRWPRCFHPKEEEAPGGQVGRLGQAGCEARWAGVVSVWASRQAKAQGGGGQWAGPICGEMEKPIHNLIFGFTRI